MQAQDHSSRQTTMDAILFFPPVQKSSCLAKNSWAGHITLGIPVVLPQGSTIWLMRQQRRGRNRAEIMSSQPRGDAFWTRYTCVCCTSVGTIEQGINVMMHVAKIKMVCHILSFLFGFSSDSCTRWREASSSQAAETLKLQYAENVAIKQGTHISEHRYRYYLNVICAFYFLLTDLS